MKLPPLDDHTTMEQYERYLADYYNYIERCDRRILKVIRRMKGISFTKNLIRCLKESEVNDRLTIVNSTGRGKWQEEEWGPIKGMWVDQYVNGGYSGDEYEGYIYIAIKRGKWLKCHYSM